jgi:hypothetical protein
MRGPPDLGLDAVRPGLFVSAALRLAGALLRSAPLTDPACSFPRLMRHDDAPGLSLRSCAGGCFGPLLAPCCATCSSLLMRRRRRSVTHSHDAQGLGLAASQLVTFAPCRGARSGRCGLISPPPVLCSLAGMGKHPPAHNPAGRTPPAPEGTGSRMREPYLKQQGAGPGGEDKATVTGRGSGRSLALSGGPDRGDRGPPENRRAGYGHTARLPGVRDDRSRCVPGWAVQNKNSAQKRYFVKRTTQRLYFHPAHGGGLYALPSITMW